jgi:hypothetical protein
MVLERLARTLARVASARIMRRNQRLASGTN